MARSTHSLEVKLLHPALALILEGRGDDWFYEVSLGGTRKRVDFLVHGENDHSLIDCKMELNPLKDIPQMNFYHGLYGDKHARKVIATTNKVYKHAIIRQYTEANISIMRVEGDFTVSSYLDYIVPDVRVLYPHRCHYHVPLTTAEIDAIRASYNRRTDTIREVAERNGLTISATMYILNGVWSHHPYGTPRPIPSEETSI